MNAAYLVDGTFELFRCFHGAPRATHDGREVGAIRGLLQSLVALLRRPDLTWAAVAFDPTSGTLRLPSDAGPNAVIRAQYDLALDAVRALGLSPWPVVRCQADDALATGAFRLREDPRVDRVVICTTDKDLAQCVRGRRVVLLDRIRKVETDEDGVRARFGVAPAQIPELFALVGDPSDGLPGLPGWGQASSAAVLRAFGRVEDIPLDPTSWGDVGVRGARRLAEVLAERRLEVILQRDLSIRRTDLPLPHALDDLRWRGARRGPLEALCERVGDGAVLERVPRWAEP